MSWLTIDGGPAENLHRNRGIGIFVRALVKSLADDGVHPKIQYVSCRPIDSTSARWSSRSRSARLTGVDRVWPDRCAVAWQLLDTAWVLPRDVGRTGADLFLATDPNAIAIGRRFSTVAMLYDLIPLIFPEHYLRGVRATLRRVALADSVRRMRKARALIAISNTTRNDAVRLLGVPPSSIEVVPLAVEHAIFHPRAAEGHASVTGGAPYLLYVGEADARKRVTMLIEVFRELAIEGLHLVLAGGSETTRGRLRAICGDDPRVHLLGPIDDGALAAVYGGALAFVFPSVYEGFGLPVLEAMACGTPVVCSARAALPEVAGQAALFADPDRAESFREAIRHVATDPALRAELRQQGLEQAAKFRWRDTRDGIIDVCRGLA